MTAQENGQLFRREAIAYRAQAAEGKPRLASPPAFHVLCVLLGTAVLIAIVFLSTGSYARKATVAGLIEADLGIKRVVSPRSAVVERVYVMAGASVNVGDPLVCLKTTPDLDESQRQQMLAEYQEQLRSIRQRIEHLNDQQQQEHQRLVQRRLQLLNSVNEHHTIIRLQSMKRDEIAVRRPRGTGSEIRDPTDGTSRRR